MALSHVYLYSEPRWASVDFHEVHAFTRRLLPDTAIHLRGAFLEENPAVGGEWTYEELAQALAAARVSDPSRPAPKTRKVLPGEAAYELRRLRDPKKSVFGILYDAYSLAYIIYGVLIHQEESGLDRLHVVFTDQLIGTWDAADKRYHARTVLCGPVSIVSLSGITVAPAKDPGFYIARQGAEAFGLAEEAKDDLAFSFAGDFIGVDDHRMTEAVKGYVAQAVAYSLTGEAFCDDPDCRLYNAHWQRELIRAQLGGGDDFCRRHAAMFNYQAMGDQR